MNWKRQRIIAFDTETTGLNPHDGDRVIEFAGVELVLSNVGEVADVQYHHFLFNPGIPIPRKVVEITGIDDDTVADAPAFEADGRKIFNLLQDSILVAHNFPFDRAFLTTELQRAGQDWPHAMAEVDTIDLSIRYFPDVKGHKLEQVAQRLAVALDRAHRATDDAEACGRCFVEMAKRFEAPDELEGLLDWADALGRPPVNGYLGFTDKLRFSDGPYQGEPVDSHPLHLQWMLMARHRVNGGWQYRFPESLRRWSERYLRVRAAGRARQNAKSFGADQWVIDSSALPLPEAPADPRTL
jgi:DNA polymerase III epsilon subunit family exonuclease